MSDVRELTRAERGFAAAWLAMGGRGSAEVGRSSAPDPATSAALAAALHHWRAAGPPDEGQRAALMKGASSSGPAEAPDARILLSVAGGAQLLAALTRVGGHLIASMRPEAPLRPLMELTLGVPPELAAEFRGWLLSPPSLGEALGRRVRETYVRLIGSRRSPDQVAEFGLYFVVQAAALRHPELNAHLRSELGGRMRARLADFESAALRSSQADLLNSIEQVVFAVLRPPELNDTEEMREVADG